MNRLTVTVTVTGGRFRSCNHRAYTISLMYFSLARRQKITRNAVSGIARIIPRIPSRADPQKKIQRVAAQGWRRALQPGDNLLTIAYQGNEPAEIARHRPTLFASRPASRSDATDSTAQNPKSVLQQLTSQRYSSSSRRLVAMDHFTGAVRWSRDARLGFRHNNITIGGGRVFCIDGLSAEKQKELARRGAPVDGRCAGPR